ncbi:MAG: hypothetical protein R3C05_17035 [Pirellulaceae bacterium]
MLKDYWLKLLIVSLLVTTSIQADESVREAKSYLEIVADNAEALVRYDVLLREEHVSLIPDGPYFEQTVTRRMLCDRESNRFYCVSKGRIDSR